MKPTPRVVLQNNLLSCDAATIYHFSSVLITTAKKSMKNCGRRSATVSSVGQGTLKKWTEISKSHFLKLQLRVWCLQISQKTNDIFVRISALAS